jgi:hypothetical protein
MKTTALLVATAAALLAISSAHACPADTSLEDGPAAASAPVSAVATPRHCAVHVAGNPKLGHFRRKPISCGNAYATRPAKRRDAA